jgi:radical SAM protein with 4Fe4S-binding SPASM domain
MKAHLLNGESPGGNRIPLSKLVPLDTPLVIQVFPIYACNFKCKYCTYSIPNAQREFISDITQMDLGLFIKCIQDIAQFPRKLLTLRFVGMGEPLLHPQIVEMIQYVFKIEIAERIELITNGSLLIRALSDKLTTSGLTKLLISIQGTTREKYKEISKINIDFNQFIENIKYFYDNRQNVKVHIKIADCALDDDKDKQKFFDIFGDICDTISIEKIGPIHPGVEYNSELLNKSSKVNQYGEPFTESSICSQPFYMIQINPDGNVVPCFAIPYPKILGNCNKQSLLDIWNGKDYNNFRLNILNGLGCTNNQVCDECRIFKHRTHNSDDLHTKIDKLKKVYS